MNGTWFISRIVRDRRDSFFLFFISTVSRLFSLSLSGYSFSVWLSLIRHTQGDTSSTILFFTMMYNSKGCREWKMIVMMMMLFQPKMFLLSEDHSSRSSLSFLIPLFAISSAALNLDLSSSLDSFLLPQPGRRMKRETEKSLTKWQNQGKDSQQREEKKWRVREEKRFSSVGKLCLIFLHPFTNTILIFVVLNIYIFSSFLSLYSVSCNNETDFREQTFHYVLCLCKHTLLELQLCPIWFLLH